MITPYEKVDRVRALNSAHEAFLFGLAMMLHACDREHPDAEVLELGQVILETLLGSTRFAQLALAELDLLTRQLGQTADLKQVLRRCLRSWLGG